MSQGPVKKNYSDQQTDANDVTKELIEINNQKLVINQLNQAQEKLEAAIVDPKKQQLVLGQEIKENRELITLQQRTIEELKSNLNTLTVQKEVSDLKSSTLSLVASKNNKELAQLKKEIHLYEVNMEEQQAQMRVLHESIETSTKDIDLKKNELESLKKDLFLKKRRSIEDKKDFKTINDEIVDYNEKIVKLKSEIDNEARNLAHLEKELENLKQEHTTRSNELETLFIQLLSKQKRHEGLKVQKEQLVKNLAKNKLEITNTENEIDHWKKNIDHLDQEIATLSASLERKNLEYTSQREALSKYMLESDLKRNIFEEESIRERELNATLVSTKDKIDRIRQELSKKQDEVFELRRNIEQKKTHIAILDEEGSSLSQAVITFEKDINKNEAIQTSLDSTLKSLKNTVADLQTKRAGLNEEVAGQEKIIAATRTEIALFEQDIEKLKVMLSELSSTAAQQGSTLTSLEQRTTQLNAHKEDRRREVKEKEQVIKEQYEHIQELDNLLKQSQREYQLTEEKAKDLNQKLLDNQRFLEEMNKSVGSSENYLSDVRNRVKISINELRESDALIFDSLQELEIQKITYESIDRDLRDKLRAVAGNKETRDKEMALYQENLARLQGELQRRLNRAATLKHEIEKSKVDLSECKTQIQVVADRIETSGKRNQELQAALEDQSLNYNHLCGQRDDLVKELEHKTKTENMTLAQIEEKEQHIEQLSAEYHVLKSRENDLRHKLESETQNLERLQMEETGKRAMIASQRSAIITLNENVDEIKLTNNDYTTKIEAQNNAMEENARVLEVLTRKNRSLIEQLAAYEEVYNRNLKAMEAQKENIDGLNRLANERQSVLEGYSKHIGENIDQVSPVALAEMANLERAIDVSPMDQMMAFKRALESRYFNLTVAIDEQVAMMHELVDSETIQVASTVHTHILKAFESCFGSEAEVLLDIHCNDNMLNTSMNVSSIKDMPGHQAKDVLVPLAKQLMHRFAAFKTHVNYRIKLNSAGNIEKLTAEIKVAVPTMSRNLDKAS